MTCEKTKVGVLIGFISVIVALLVLMQFVPISTIFLALVLGLLFALPVSALVLVQLIESLIIEIQKQYIKDNKKANSFYSVEARGWMFFVAQNESGFTLMFPEDY